MTNLVDVPAFMLVTTAKDFPVKSVPELIDYAKKNPGKVRYGTVGVGSYPHYDMAYFAKRAGDLDMVAHAQQERRLRRDPGHAARRRAGRLPQRRRAAGPGAGRQACVRSRVVNHARLPDYPDVPTMQEVGFPDVGTIAWHGLFAPAATPKPVLEAIFDATVAAMKEPAVVEAFKKQTFNIVPNTSLADAKTWLAGQMDIWRKITSEVKIETE